MNRWETDFSDNIRVGEAENSFHLIEGDRLCDANEVLIVGRALTERRKLIIASENVAQDDSPHISHARKDESLGGIKAHRDNVFDVLDRQSQSFFDCQVLPVSFLVVSHLNHEWNVERFLQPPENVSSANFMIYNFKFTL